MAGCVSGFGLAHAVNVRNEVVLGKMWNQSFIFDVGRFRNSVKDVAFPIFRGKNSSRNVYVKTKRRFLVMSNMSESSAEPQSGVATTIVTKEGDDGRKGRDVKALETNHESKTDNGGNGGDMSDGSGGNGKFNNGRGGGGGGDDNEENDQEEKEFGPIMKFDEVMKEVEARGASLPSDMFEAAKNVGIRKMLLLRYLDLQSSSWPLGFLVKSWAMLRNRMLADPSFLFKIGTEIVIDSCCATFAEVQKRGKDFWAEFELYVSDLLVGVVVNVALVGMLAPYVRIGQPSVSKGLLGRLQQAYGALPSSVFEAERPGCRFSINQRIGTYFFKGVMYGTVGFACGIIGQGIANLIMNAKRFALIIYLNISCIYLLNAISSTFLVFTSFCYVTGVIQMIDVINHLVNYLSHFTEFSQYLYSKTLLKIYSVLMFACEKKALLGVYSFLNLGSFSIKPLLIIIKPNDNIGM